MACACRKGRRIIVELPGGLRITKTDRAAAEAFVARHPGARIIG